MKGSKQIRETGSTARQHTSAALICSGTSVLEFDRSSRDTALQESLDRSA